MANRNASEALLMDTFVDLVAVLGLTGVAFQVAVLPLTGLIPGGILVLTWLRPSEWPDAVRAPHTDKEAPAVREAA